MAKKKQDYFYLKIRVAVEKPLTKEQIEDVANNLDYTIKSGTNGVTVVDTQLEESSLTWVFGEDDDEEL